MRLPVGVGDHDLGRRERRCSGRLAVQHVQADDHLLEAEVAGRRVEAPRQPVDDIGVEDERRRHEERDAVPVQPAPRVAHAQAVAQRARGVEEGALEGRQV